jgi:predicted ATPase
MSEYVRTAIRRLRIEGYRSLRSVELRDLDEMVVLHGPNGSGKSNLLRAAQLIFRWAALEGELPNSRADAKVYDEVTA